MRKTISGFTLIEVLVASVILFSSIAIVSLVYRGAYLSSEKANQSINITKSIPSILSIIKEEIRDATLLSKNEAGNSSSAWDVEYQWKGKVIASQKAPSRLDPNFGTPVPSIKTFKLWQVELIVSYQDKSKVYQYTELGWDNAR